MIMLRVVGRVNFESYKLNNLSDCQICQNVRYDDGVKKAVRLKHLCLM